MRLGRDSVSNLKSLLRDDSGQGTVEYILILSFAAVFAATLAKNILRALDSGILALGSELEKDLKSGRASVTIWKN